MCKVIFTDIVCSIILIASVFTYALVNVLFSYFCYNLISSLRCLYLFVVQLYAKKITSEASHSCHGAAIAWQNQVTVFIFLLIGSGFSTSSLVLVFSSRDCLSRGKIKSSRFFKNCSDGFLLFTPRHIHVRHTSPSPLSGIAVSNQRLLLARKSTKGD